MLHTWNTLKGRFIFLASLVSFIIFFPEVAGAIDGCGPIKDYDEDGGVLNCLPTPDHGSGLPVTGGIDWQVVILILVAATAVVLTVQAVRNRSR